MVNVKQYEQEVKVVNHESNMFIKTQEVVTNIKTIESVSIENDESNSEFPIDLVLLYQTALIL
ncbi:hypothetical protein [Runella sp. SP2]|uniref:hypothetical protein n=1 Tax=Runella sp. SP2 TaxID=2268026 RepID=UPI000F08D2C1|nr:hypothetical protein [Runella sp. SP2]AYQ31377.1 hypothetical protein DTQ70_03930 [Runella sp. SP2]